MAGVAGETRGAAGRRALRAKAGAFSVARSIIRPISATLTASASSARAQAASTVAGPHRFTRPSRA